MEAARTTNRKLSLGEKLSYGMGDCGANVIVALASTYLSAYYTDTVGIAAAAVATMMMVTRIFDGVTDIIMGAIVDKTNSRWGKARPWVLWTAPFMALSLFLLFNVPSSFGDTGKLVYAYLTYIFQSCIVYTAANLPYNALLSRMTLDVQDRASTSSIRFIMTQLTTLIINAVTANLVESVGFEKLSAIYAGISFIMLMICFFGAKEHLGETAQGSTPVESVPLKTALPALFKNRYFLILSLLFCFVFIANISTLSVTFYFCNDILGDVTLLTFCSMALTIPSMIINFALPGLVSKFGKQKMMILGSCLMILGGVLVGLAGSNVPLVMTGIVLKGFGLGPIQSGVFAMAADVVDYGEWKTGVRSEGLINSCTSFGMKIGIGVGSSVGLWILDLGGYDGLAAVQTESALNAVRFAFGYNGAILSVVVLILCILMNIDKYIKQIQSDLEKKRA